MFGFLIFSQLFSDNKYSKGSKFLPYPSLELVLKTRKYYKNGKKRNKKTDKNL